MERSAVLAVRDTAHNRDVLVRVDFPSGAPQPLPVVLFSPGGGINPNGHEGNPSWGNTLATAGFAVIRLNAADIAHGTYCAEFQVPAAECEGVDFSQEVADGGSLPAVMIARPRDASAVLDQLGLIANQIGVALDPSRVAMAGYSSGAHTAMVTAGARVDLSPTVRGISLADPRFLAYLALSPQGIGRLGFNVSSWEGITKPVLTQTGSNDYAVNQTPDTRQHPYTFMPPGDKYQAFFISPEATHFTFSLENSSSYLTNFIGRNAVAFFDAYLRGLPAARAWLTTNQLGIWSASIGQMSAK